MVNALTNYCTKQLMLLITVLDYSNIPVYVSCTGLTYNADYTPSPKLSNSLNYIYRINKLGFLNIRHTELSLKVIKNLTKGSESTFSEILCPAGYLFNVLQTLLKSAIDAFISFQVLVNLWIHTQKHSSKGFSLKKNIGW